MCEVPQGSIFVHFFQCISFWPLLYYQRKQFQKLCGCQYALCWKILTVLVSHEKKIWLSCFSGFQIIIKLDCDKCHLVYGKICGAMNVSGIEIKKTKNLLRIKIDCGLKFKNLSDRVIEKTIDKVNALFRVAPFISYCPLVWIVVAA